MRFVAEDYYVRASAYHVVVGAIFLNVPITFQSGDRIPAVLAATDGSLRRREFEEVWSTASPQLRQAGIPALARAKPRPALIVRLGARVSDVVYRGSL